jgi:hypothetical protein
LKELADLAKRINRFEETAELASPSASVLVLPRGARVLGVDLGCGNLLWVNPKVSDVLTKNGWNIGGIRTWISPERAFFYDNPQTFQGWRCPPGIDPDNYCIVSRSVSNIQLKGTISAKDMISGETLSGEVMKKVELNEVNRKEKSLSATIMIHDTLTVRDFASPFALWTLLQVPPGDNGRGVVSIPVIQNSKPIHYFGPIPSSHLRLFKDHVEFIIDGKKELKLGIRPEDLPNPKKASLYYRLRKKRVDTLITVSSQSGATRQDECVDPAKSDPNGSRAVVQTYNSDLKSSGLSFGELEIQGAQAKKRSNGRTVAEQQIIIDFKARTKW